MINVKQYNNEGGIIGVQVQFGLRQLDSTSQAAKETTASSRKTYGGGQQWHFQGPMQE